MSDDDLDALSELLERATKLGLLSEAAVDRLTDAIALGECSEEEVTLRDLEAAAPKRAPARL